MKEQLERLVDEMVVKGVRYEDAHREFEKRFIASALAKTDGNLGKAADLLGIHRNTLSRKMANTGSAALRCEPARAGLQRLPPLTTLAACSSLDTSVTLLLSRTCSCLP